MSVIHDNSEIGMQARHKDRKVVFFLNDMLLNNLRGN